MSLAKAQGGFLKHRAHEETVWQQWGAGRAASLMSRHVHFLVTPKANSLSEKLDILAWLVVFALVSRSHPAIQRAVYYSVVMQNSLFIFHSFGDDAPVE